MYLKDELLSDLVVPDGVTEIKGYVFSNCSALVNVTIPNRVTSIENSAFTGCSGLISVAIGNGAFLVCM